MVDVSVRLKLLDSGVNPVLQVPMDSVVWVVNDVNVTTRDLKTSSVTRLE